MLFHNDLLFFSVQMAANGKDVEVTWQPRFGHLISIIYAWRHITHLHIICIISRSRPNFQGQWKIGSLDVFRPFNVKVKKFEKWRFFILWRNSSLFNGTRIAHSSSLMNTLTFTPIKQCDLTFCLILWTTLYKHWIE